MRAFVGVGGNVGSEAALLERFRTAIDAIARLPWSGGIETSPLYRSDPHGPVTEQPEFLNAVIAVELTGDVEPAALLADLLQIERDLGRTRALAQGPRTLDLDLLAIDDIVLEDPGPPPLTLPHPGLGERAFVLRPLADLAGLDWTIPGTGVRIAERLADPAIAAQRLDFAGQL